MGHQRVPSSQLHISTHTPLTIIAFYFHRNFILFNNPLSVGAVIPYLSLTFHAIQRVGADSGLFMQLSLSPDISSTSNPDDYDNEDLIELNLIPTVTGEVSQPEAT